MVCLDVFFQKWIHTDNISWISWNISPWKLLSPCTGRSEIWRNFPVEIIREISELKKNLVRGAGTGKCFIDHCLRLGSIQKTNFTDNQLGWKYHPFSQLELTPEAHILCVGRVHEYYLQAKYQHQTPIISGRTVIILENQLSIKIGHHGCYLISNSDLLKRDF